jgi:signal transduction histidine kinase
MRVEDLRALSLFAGLTDEQIGELIDGGAEVAVEPGVELFREGEHSDFWWVLLDGSIELTRHIGQERTVVGRMTPGLWAGGFRAWDEHGVYLATGTGAIAGRVLQVPAGFLADRFNAWFPFGRHLIEGLYGTARTIESMARQRQSLVTLGQLAAGLAHEINNPAAAAVRAVDALETSNQVLVSSLRMLADGQISAQQFTALDELRRELDPETPLEDPLVLSDREEELTSWLMQRRVEREWLIAPPLAAAGADLAWCERAAAVLPGPALEPGLDWVASTVSAATLLADIRQSTRRISELVGAVRSYSQMDRSSMQRIDVTGGIESTLTMLAHKLGDSVTVVRQYGADAPEVEAHAGELNQVWTVLIDNAIDAMDGAGTLTITTSAAGDGVLVEIADTGAGMPAEVAARAFEAFFTTKEVGKGSGLGLDTARRIVEEHHGGTITIESRPGDTVLRVRLPARLRTARQSG